MGIAGRCFLLFHTIRYLKPTQLVNQVLVRVKPKEQFWKYEKKHVKYKRLSLWIDGLDNNPGFMERFKPEGLLHNELTLLHESRKFHNKWQYSGASRLWNFNVHYLEYVVPLFSLWKATGDEKYREKINEILYSWYESGSREPDSNQAYTISLRIVHQLIITDAVDDRQKLYDAIYAQYKYLLNHQEKHLLGNHYLENLKAIVICSVVFDEADVYEKYLRKLLDELAEEITKDGLHFERSLMYHKIVLEDLIRVAVVLKQAGKNNTSGYRRIMSCLNRMVTALYFIEYGIGRTVLFNDAGNNVAKPAEALVSISEQLFGIHTVTPENTDSMSGYHKLYDGRIAVIVDCGELSPVYMPGHAHNDCLSFELFYDGKPLFVNSGTYQYQGDKRAYFRSTAAHNTVMINGHEQSELWGEHRAGRRMHAVKGKRNKNTVAGYYKNYLGESHKRKIRLADGVIKVMDRTSGDGQSYLHLAPGLKYERKPFMIVCDRPGHGHKYERKPFMVVSDRPGHGHKYERKPFMVVSDRQRHGHKYESGKITGADVDIKIRSINADVDIRIVPYSDSFGKTEEIECLVFSWNADKQEHGYMIEIKEIDTDD